MNTMSQTRMSCTFHGVAALLTMGLTLVACGDVQQPETIAARTSALTGTITISGVVSETSGVTLGDITVKLTGSAQATTITDFDGKYQFTVSPGSYTVTAQGFCGVFAPALANLNNLTANATADFLGSGGLCSLQTASGGTSGSLTIAGTVTSAGHAIAGARVTLNGSVQGFRITDQAGAYSFRVNPGSYSLAVSGGCNSFAPSVVNLNNVTHSLTQSFTGSGNCPTAPLALCPTLDSIFLGASEPAECNIVSTPDCALDRSAVWDFGFLLNFANAIFADCRFGAWFSGPGALTDPDIVTYVNDLTTFGLYFFGCPATGTEVAPLSFQLIPRAFASRTFTTADVQALSAAYAAAVAQAVSDIGSPPLDAAQTNAINTQLAFLAGRLPHLTNSTTFSSSTCP